MCTTALVNKEDRPSVSAEIIMAKQKIKVTEDLVEIVNNEQEVEEETEDLVEVVNEEGHQPLVSKGVVVVTSWKITEEEKRKAKERKERLFVS